MTTTSPRPQRRSIRLPEFDYSQAGAYFVTICSPSDACLFGSVQEETIALNAMRELLQRCWQAIPHHFPHASLDRFVVMLNPLHGTVFLAGRSGTAPQTLPALFGRPVPGSLPTIIASFKAAVSRGLRKQSSVRFTAWHRNYYEHILRSEADFARIRECISNTPLQWAIDAERSHGRYGEKLPWAGMTCHAPTKSGSLEKDAVGAG